MTFDVSNFEGRRKGGGVSFVPFLYIYIYISETVMTRRWMIACSISNAMKSTGKIITSLILGQEG